MYIYAENKWSESQRQASGIGAHSHSVKEEGTYLPGPGQETKPASGNRGSAGDQTRRSAFRNRATNRAAVQSLQTCFGGMVEGAAVLVVRDVPAPPDSCLNPPNGSDSPHSVLRL